MTITHSKWQVQDSRQGERGIGLPVLLASTAESHWSPPSHTDQSLSHTHSGRQKRSCSEKLRRSQSFFSLRHLDAREQQQRQTCFLVSCPELLHNNMGSTHLHTHAWAQPHPAEHESSFTTVGGCCSQARNAAPYPKEAVKAEESIYRFNKKCGNLRQATVQSL